MGKVYSGLYECAGHVVPYLVVVKVGKLTERSRPGNRGKRDSQMVIMHFLNKVRCRLRVQVVAKAHPRHIGSLQFANEPTGVGDVSSGQERDWCQSDVLRVFVHDRCRYHCGSVLSEPFDFCVCSVCFYVLTDVHSFFCSMVHDKKVLGVCGETTLSNAKQSIITMMQVYEYFISHHMAKAFESLFGSVTCLPGCFTLFRLCTADTHKPLLISNQMISDYSQNRVDTLHMKNLLHLGEDRYLTTLLLKPLSTHKTQFIRDAHAYTVAPDDWVILLSQLCRWINSTVHNLGERMFLDQLCASAVSR
jgi:chitin synthase